LLKISRETVRVIRQNILVFAFFVNFLGIVLTAWIMPRWSQTWLERSPVAAALFHQIGSVLVLLNAMRLLWFERWQASIFGRAETALADWFDSLIRAIAPAADALRRLWSHRRRVAWGLAALLLALYAASGVSSVGPDEVAVARRCGRLAGVLQPGLHVRLPFPWENITRYRPARVRTAEIGWRRTPRSPSTVPGAIEWNSPHVEAVADRREEEALALTGDQSLVEVGAVVQYRIADVVAYAFAGREPDRLFKVAAEGAIREVLAAYPLLADAADGNASPEILTTARAQLQREIRERLQTRLNQFALGLEVLPDGVLLQDVHPPLAVVPAFRDVSSAFKEQERMKNEAWAYHRDKVIKAGGLEAWQKLSKPGATLTEELWQELRPRLQGEAAAELHAAEAFAASEQEVAHGNAESFVLNEAARAAAPQLTDWRLAIDTIGESLTGKKKLILDRPTGGRRHLFLGLPSGSLLPGINPAAIAPPIRPEVED
jgi:Cu+-exporting ATPase